MLYQHKPGWDTRGGSDLAPGPAGCGRAGQQGMHAISLTVLFPTELIHLALWGKWRFMPRGVASLFK